MSTLAFFFGVSLIALAPDPEAYRPFATTPERAVQLTTNAEGRLLYDFGRVSFGFLRFVGGTNGAYNVHLGETITPEGVVKNISKGSSICTHRLTGNAPGGDFRVPITSCRKSELQDALERAVGEVEPFRYVEIFKVPAGTDLLRVSVHYPIDMHESSFSSSSAELNKVYDFCKYSIWATSFYGVYIDGNRERLPYEGDGYINQLDDYAIESDYSLGRFSTEWLITHPTWPTEWKQHAIKMAWNDWMWTGDVRLLERHYETFKREKLLGTFKRADIVDWPLGERDGYVFAGDNEVVEAFHCRNLEEMRDIAAAIGRAEESADFAKRAEAARTAFRAAYRDGDGLYRDAKGTEHKSLHANAIALAFGLVPEEEQAKVVDYLDGKGMVCSVYFAQFLLEAFCEAGRADLALKYICASGPRSWLGMMDDTGATITMEAWSFQAKPNADLNHAWGAAPLNIISRYILGVTPLEPGFAKISVRPQPGGLESVSGTVPTAKGPVRVEIKGDWLKVAVPVPARIVWKGSVRDVPAGSYELN